jgi:CheY-like chemotaxis protein
MPKKKFTTCIIIDDDPINIFLHKVIIRRLQNEIEIVAFSDASKGLEYIKGNYSEDTLNNTLILLDLNMPVMNGKQFIKEIMKLDETIKKQLEILIVSSSIDEFDMESCHLYRSCFSVSKIIQKPLTLKMVKEIIF